MNNVLFVYCPKVTKQYKTHKQVPIEWIRHPSTLFQLNLFFLEIIKDNNYSFLILPYMDLFRISTLYVIVFPSSIPLVNYLINYVNHNIMQVGQACSG